MTLTDFLEELASYYPMQGKEESNAKKIVKWRDLLLTEMRKTKKTYDFEKLLNYILKDYKYKYFPNISDLLEYLPYGIKQDYSRKIPNGGKVRVFLAPSKRNPQGLYVDYEPYYCNLTLDEVREKFVKLYTVTTTDTAAGKPTRECRVKDIKYYPPETEEEK